MRWFPNRWPAMPDGRCEVILYTPRHDATFAELGVDGAHRVVELWAERTAVLGAREDVAYVLVFENRGPEVGATITHPHGQIYAFDFVPELPLRELRRSGPVSEPGERLVATADGWRAWVPEAPTFPYVLLLMPDDPVPDLPSLDAAGRRAMGAAAGRRARAARPPVRGGDPVHAVDPPAAVQRRPVARRAAARGDRHAVAGRRRAALRGGRRARLRRLLQPGRARGRRAGPAGGA